MNKQDINPERQYEEDEALSGKPAVPSVPVDKVASDQISTADLVENILSDLEDSVAASDQMLQVPVIEEAKKVLPQGEAPETTKETADSEHPECTEQIKVIEHAETSGDDDKTVLAASDNTEEVTEDEKVVPACEESETSETVDHPLFAEEPLHEHQQETDETGNMSLVERARYHARMRRREQTRLRRENAKRGTVNREVSYQPMSAVDMRVTLIRLGIAAVLLIPGFIFRGSTMAFIVNLIAYLIAVLPILVKVAQNFAHGKYFDEYLLIFVASLGAFLLDRQPEAVTILVLHGAGKIVSDLVLKSTNNSLTKQTDFVPGTASLVNMKGEEKKVAPSEIKVGDFVLVRDGERIPIDGTVLRGEGTIDDTVLTGDSEPIPIAKDGHALAGSLYSGSLLLLRADSRFEDCAVSRVMRVQKESAECRASLESSMQKSARYVMMAGIVLGVLLSVIPPLFRSGIAITSWMYRALTIVVICCPTALAVSVPLSFLAGIGKLSQKGIHVKGSATLEKLAELRMAVFDKTGTLTKGTLQVKEIRGTQDFNEESCLALAATAEQLSQHPVARAVVNAYQGTLRKLSEFEEFPGRGVRARIGNRNLLVGNRRLMISRGVKGVPDIRGTVVYVAYEGDYAGAIVLEDTIREEASDAIAGLKSQGVMRTVILTGDTEQPAQQTADAIGIDTIHYGLTPEEKASKMEFLLRTIPTDGTAAYIGDGINDIEELKLADVGVAMGAAGSLETADAANVLIMTQNLTRVVDAVHICRRTHGIVLQNIVLVILIKALLVLLSLLGAATMWQAIAADVLLTVLTVLNATRIQGTK